MSDPDLRTYVGAVRALIDELNREACSGLIAHSTLPLISVVDRQTAAMEKRLPAGLHP